MQRDSLNYDMRGRKYVNFEQPNSTFKPLIKEVIIVAEEGYPFGGGETIEIIQN